MQHRFEGGSFSADDDQNFAPPPPPPMMMMGVSPTNAAAPPPGTSGRLSGNCRGMTFEEVSVSRFGGGRYSDGAVEFVPPVPTPAQPRRSSNGVLTMPSMPLSTPTAAAAAAAAAVAELQFGVGDDVSQMPEDVTSTPQKQCFRTGGIARRRFVNVNGVGADDGNNNNLSATPDSSVEGSPVALSDDAGQNPAAAAGAAGAPSDSLAVRCLEPPSAPIKAKSQLPSQNASRNNSQDGGGDDDDDDDDESTGPVNRGLGTAPRNHSRPFSDLSSAAVSSQHPQQYENAPAVTPPHSPFSSALGRLRVQQRTDGVATACKRLLYPNDEFSVRRGVFMGDNADSAGTEAMAMTPGGGGGGGNPTATRLQYPSSLVYGNSSNQDDDYDPDLNFTIDDDDNNNRPSSSNNNNNTVPPPFSQYGGGTGNDSAIGRSARMMQFAAGTRGGRAGVRPAAFSTSSAHGRGFGLGMQQQQQQQQQQDPSKRRLLSISGRKLEQMNREARQQQQQQQQQQHHAQQPRVVPSSAISTSGGGAGGGGGADFSSLSMTVGDAGGGVEVKRTLDMRNGDEEFFVDTLNAPQQDQQQPQQQQPQSYQDPNSVSGFGGVDQQQPRFSDSSVASAGGCDTWSTASQEVRVSGSNNSSGLSDFSRTRWHSNPHKFHRQDALDGGTDDVASRFSDSSTAE